MDGCSGGVVYRELLPNAAPGADGKNPVTEDSFTAIVFLGHSGGDVFHIIDSENLRVANITADNHVFYFGIVIRSVENREGTIGIRSFGEGVNKSTLAWVVNNLTAEPGWNMMDNRIRKAVLGKTEQGRRILSREQETRDRNWQELNSRPKY